MKLILASASPRRKELLTHAGIPFEVQAAEVDEHCGCPAAEAVRILSSRKARAVHARFPGRFILAADTLVELDGQVLGKPSDPEDAAGMLRRLSGRTHQVYTGVTVISPAGDVFTDCDRSDVTFGDVTGPEIAAYVQSGEPMDKAGAYALQGRASLWVSRMEGSYSSVIGLPLFLVRALLLKAGYPLVDESEDSLQITVKMPSP